MTTIPQTVRRKEPKKMIAPILQQKILKLLKMMVSQKNQLKKSTS